MPSHPEQRTEPTITCPRCSTEIKLTESLAAPLIEATRRDYERRITVKDSEIAERETVLREREEALLRDKTALDQQVTEKVEMERARIAAEEAGKARLAIESDLEDKGRLIADLGERLKRREEQVAEAQKARDQLARERSALEDAKRDLEFSIEEKLREARVKIAEEEARKARRALENDLGERQQEIADLQETLALRDQKLAQAQQVQAELLKKQRALDEERRELELTVEKRVQEGLDLVRQQARRETEEALQLKVMEKEETISAMQRQIEDLKRRAEQGSQQLQGEVLELALEALLSARFPMDAIEPVPKGVSGGDVMQRVIGPFLEPCGTILWESKRTKNWNDGWLAKLRDDQRAAKAEVAVLVSQALPRETEVFDCIDGVWVTHPRAALPVALCLRDSLIQIALARKANQGRQSKMELVYQYLVGPQFRQRVEAIVESFSSMQDDLNREKKAIMKQWAKRETQINRVMEATVGMYGDLQGIAGTSLQELAGLSLPALDENAALLENEDRK